LLNKQIAQITGIEERILSDYAESESLGFEDKMKWVKNRETTKTEDIAYCLLGLFDVNMLLLSGEGHKALLRLAEQVDKAMGKHQNNKIGASLGSGIDRLSMTATDDHTIPYGIGSQLIPPRLSTLAESNESPNEILVKPWAYAMGQPNPNEILDNYLFTPYP
jgi:hypothetical protein